MTATVVALRGNARPQDTPDPDTPWTALGACVGSDPDLFFPERGASAYEARQVCAGCPVSNQCLDYALANREKHGVWGGLPESQRRGLRRGDGMDAGDRIISVMNPGSTYSIRHISSLLGIQYHSSTVGAMLRLENEGRVVCVQRFRSSQYPALYQLCGGEP